MSLLFTLGQCIPGSTERRLVYAFVIAASTYAEALILISSCCFTNRSPGLVMCQ